MSKYGNILGWISATPLALVGACSTEIIDPIQTNAQANITVGNAALFTDSAAFLATTHSTLAVDFPTPSNWGSQYVENGVSIRQVNGHTVGVLADRSPATPGNKLGISGPEDIDIVLPHPEHIFGMYIEDSTTDPNSPGVCPKVDSSFLFTFRSGGPGGAVVAEVDVDPPVNQQFFVGVVVDQPFDLVQVREYAPGVTGDLCENDYFGDIYLGGVLDSDGDGIPDPADQCPDTTIPEQTVPGAGRLNPNHFALLSEGGTFTKGSPRGGGRGMDATYTLQDTTGCNCEQIVAALGAGKGHLLHGCSPSIMEEWVTSLPATSCADLLRRDPAAASGIYRIDPDGTGALESFEVYCDMETEGGGWTLALVSSDDGQHTWTMNNSALLTTDRTPVGSLAQTDRDFKSLAWHDLAFSDLLFVHAPSGVTAVYGGVGNGGSGLGAFIDAAPYPTCDLGLADHGYPLTGGTLSLGGRLCDTDLYFNLGDHELGEADCQNLTSTWNGATMGPGWSWGNNHGCPFDDPAASGLGPSNPLCGACSSTTGDAEATGRGFGLALGLNTGAAGAAENYLQVYLR